MQAEMLKDSLDQMKAAHLGGHDPCDCLSAAELATVEGKIDFYNTRADFLDSLPPVVEEVDLGFVLQEKYPHDQARVDAAIAAKHARK